MHTCARIGKFPPNLKKVEGNSLGPVVRRHAFAAGGRGRGTRILQASQDTTRPPPIKGIVSLIAVSPNVTFEIYSDCMIFLPPPHIQSPSFLQIPP